MSLDNPLNFSIDNSIPKIIDVHHFDELLSSEKQQTTFLTCAKQREAFKKTLEEKLMHWIDIQTHTEYEYLKNLFEKYLITPNLWDTPFQSINKNLGITIKRVNNIFKIYNNPNSTQSYSKWPILSEIAEIENWKFIETGTLTSLLIREKDSKTDNVSVPADIWVCNNIKKEESEKPIPVKQKKAPETPTEYKDYKIRKWDFLWKIIKEEYWLSDNSEDIRCIWNIIEKIKKDPKNTGVIKGETWKIFVWDTLYLPTEGSYKHKWWETKIFNLHNL